MKYLVNASKIYYMVRYTKKLLATKIVSYLNKVTRHFNISAIK